MDFWQVLLIFNLSCDVRAFKILILYPSPCFSHQQAIMALTENLVQKGHEVFIVNPNAVPGLKSSNYTHVDVSFSYKSISDEKKDDTVSFQRQLSRWDMFSVARQFSLIAREQFLSQQFLQFQRQIKAEKIKFDVAIMESHFLPHACAMTRFLSGNTPIISMTTTASDPFGEEGLGSISHASYVPTYYDPYTNKMNLWQRMDSWLSQLYMVPRMREIIEEDARGFFRDTYGPESESLVDDCWTNMSLGLIGSNPVYHYPRLLGPNVVELGPLHIRTPANLPKNLQDWLDGADKGVIYFSLGSNMKSKALPKNVQANFLQFFRELPPGFRVLWKWELDGKIPGQSDNILAQKWMPQQGVLAHPKVKVFITHGGIQSFQETVHYGVPTVGIPWFGDQECNVAKMEDAQIGVRLGPEELHLYENIKSALERVLHDERYSKNMKRLSAISSDFTSQALDRAVFWVEHVARHGGASHLRPSTADTTYFQFFCLDIISVILGLSFVCVYIFMKFFRAIIAFRSYSSSYKIKNS